MMLPITKAYEKSLTLLLKESENNDRLTQGKLLTIEVFVIMIKGSRIKNLAHIS